MRGLRDWWVAYAQLAHLYRGKESLEAKYQRRDSVVKSVRLEKINLLLKTIIVVQLHFGTVTIR